MKYAKKTLPYVHKIWCMVSIYQRIAGGWASLIKSALPLQEMKEITKEHIAMQKQNNKEIKTK